MTALSEGEDVGARLQAGTCQGPLADHPRIVMGHGGGGKPSADLVDTSIWIEHFRSADPDLEALLESTLPATHPKVIGDPAMGSLRERRTVLPLVGDLPHAVPATDEEVMLFVDRHSRHGRGIGWIDVHLRAAAALSDVRLSTLDKRLAVVAAALGHGWTPH